MDQETREFIVVCVAALLILDVIVEIAKMIAKDRERRR